MSCQEQVLFVADDTNGEMIFSWECHVHQRKGIVEVQGEKVMRVRCPPKCFVPKEYAQYQWNQVLKFDEECRRQDALQAAAVSIEQLITDPMEEDTMLNGTTHTTDLGATVNTVELGEQPETKKSLKEKVASAAKAGASKLPSRTTAVAFLAGAAAMYGIERLAQMYLDNTDGE